MRAAIVHRGPDEGSTDVFDHCVLGHQRLKVVDLDALDAYLGLQYVPDNRTALRGIRKVPPGYVLVVEGDAERLERYWAPQPAEPSRSDDEWLERVRESVAAAVRKRLVADVPLGALLSGGIDSSIVVALMAETAAEPVRTFTVGF